MVKIIDFPEELLLHDLPLFTADVVANQCPFSLCFTESPPTQPPTFPPTIPPAKEGKRI